MLLGTALTSVGVIHGSIHVKMCHVWIAGIIYTVSRLLSKNYDDNHLTSQPGPKISPETSNWGDCKSNQITWTQRRSNQLLVFAESGKLKLHVYTCMREKALRGVEN